MLGKLTTKSIVAKLKIPKTHGKRAQRAHTHTVAVEWLQWLYPFQVECWMCVVFRWMAVIWRRKHIIISPLRINRRCPNWAVMWKINLWPFICVDEKSNRNSCAFRKSGYKSETMFCCSAAQSTKAIDYHSIHTSNASALHRQRHKQKEFHQWPKMAYSTCPHRVLHRRMRGAMEKNWRSRW